MKSDSWFSLSFGAVLCALFICMAVESISRRRIEAEIEIEAIKAGLEQEVIKVGGYAPVKIWVKKSNKLRVEE